MLRILAFSIILIMIGCTDTGAIKIGLDSYTISTRVMCCGAASASANAMKEANVFCESQNKQILLDHVQSGECALHGGCGEAQILFYCLAADDAQLKRPKLRRDPNFKLEVDQKQL